jgi:hypothetical protein
VHLDYGRENQSVLEKNLRRDEMEDKVDQEELSREKRAHEDD